MLDSWSHLPNRTATFEAIRKDVLTSWWEKAWNKIKAVVNAIVEFATRIAELLGEMLSLVSDIISSPRYFFNNLVTGIGRGLSTFVDRIDGSYSNVVGLPVVLVWRVLTSVRS